MNENFQWSRLLCGEIALFAGAYVELALHPFTQLQGDELLWWWCNGLYLAALNMDNIDKYQLHSLLYFHALHGTAHLFATAPHIKHVEKSVKSSDCTFAPVAWLWCSLARNSWVFMTDANVAKSADPIFVRHCFISGCHNSEAWVEFNFQPMS